MQLIFQADAGMPKAPVNRLTYSIIKYCHLVKASQEGLGDGFGERRELFFGERFFFFF